MKSPLCINRDLMSIKWDNGGETVDYYCKEHVADLSEHGCPEDCEHFALDDDQYGYARKTYRLVERLRRIRCCETCANQHKLFAVPGGLFSCRELCLKKKNLPMYKAV